MTIHTAKPKQMLYYILLWNAQNRNMIYPYKTQTAITVNTITFFGINIGMVHEY